MIAKMFGLALDLLLPKRCPYCGEVIGFTHCKACETAVPLITRICGAPISVNRGDLTVSLSPFHYEAPVKRAILAMKYQNVTEAIPFYAKKMASEICACENRLPLTLIVPVPGRKTERRRSADVPGKLARAIGKELSLPVCTTSLYKNKDTPPQQGLSGSERLHNLRGAFSVKEAQEIKGQCILLVDDVYTTGSTLRECAKTLLKAGAKSCASVCIALTNS